MRWKEKEEREVRGIQIYSLRIIIPSATVTDRKQILHTNVLLQSPSPDTHYAMGQGISANSQELRQMNCKITLVPAK